MDASSADQNEIEIVESAVGVLEEFARKLNHMKPPEVPYDWLPSARGWSVRFTNIRLRTAAAEESKRLDVFSRLCAVLNKLDGYLAKGRGLVEKLGVLAQFELMPGDLKAMDSVVILRERTYEAIVDLAPAIFGDTHSPTKRNLLPLLIGVLFLILGLIVGWTARSFW